MRFALPVLAALALAAPAVAQQKVVDTNYGFTYTIPANYRVESVRLSGTGTISQIENPIHLEINEGTTTRDLAIGGRPGTLQWLSTIQLLLLTKDVAGILGASAQDLKVLNDATARAFVQKFNSISRLGGLNLDYQRSAKVKVSGEDALAILCNASEEGISEYFTARLLLLPRAQDGKVYLFAFGALNDEYPDKVKAFDKFMASFKFMSLDDDAPKPKPIVKPKAPTPKPKRKK